MIRVETALFNIFDSAFRITILIMSLVLFVFIMAAGARTALAATLKSDVILNSDTLTVGDIFDNAGRNQNYVLGPAPQPGKDMVLNAPTLLRIALALDLAWKPQSSADQVVVTRAATIIDANAVRDALREKLKEKVIDENFSLDTGGQRLDIVLSGMNEPTLDIRNLKYDAKSGRFEAEISAPAGDRPQKKMTVTGSVRPILSVPVLNHPLRNGDIIGLNDLDMIELYASDIQPDMFLNPDDLIGLTPRRTAMAGKPLRNVDLQAPLLVSRGEGVTIICKSGPIILTASGKALQNGAKGDFIRVTNVASNRPIDAIVSGAREVVVTE